MSQSGTVAGKSFQMFMVNDQLLAKVVAATKQADSLARSKGTIQSLELFYEGIRQHIVIGRLMVIPAKVADNRDDFPLALLYGAIVREFAGEDVADLLTHKIGDTEFDEYSKADFQTIKDKLFKNNATGRYESLVVFLPSWSNPRDYITFKMTKDDQALANLLRHLVFAAYYNPAVSSAFDMMMTDLSTDVLDVTDITPKLTQPFLTANPLKSFPELEYGDGNPAKVASAKKPYACITRHTAAELGDDGLDKGEKEVLAALVGDIESKSAGVVDVPATTPIDSVAQTTIKGEGLRAHPDYGEKGSFTSEMNEENSKAAAKKVAAHKFEPQPGNKKPTLCNNCLEKKDHANHDTPADKKKADTSPGGAWTKGNGTMLTSPAIQGDDAAVSHLKSMEVEPFADPTHTDSKEASAVWGKHTNAQGQNAVSARALAAREANEAKLAKLRGNTVHAAASAKVADVEMTFDGIWGDITEDMGPAPLVDIKEQPKRKEPKTDKAETSEAPKTEEPAKTEEPKKEESKPDTDPTPPTPPARKSVRTPKEEAKEEKAEESKEEEKPVDEEPKEASGSDWFVDGKKDAAVDHGCKFCGKETGGAAYCKSCNEKYPNGEKKASIFSFIVAAEEDDDEQPAHPTGIANALSAIPEAIEGIGAIVATEDRHDDVPVAHASVVPEDQPKSNLGGPAPIATDLPPQLASVDPKAVRAGDVLAQNGHPERPFEVKANNGKTITLQSRHNGSIYELQPKNFVNWTKVGSKEDPEHAFEPNAAGMCNTCGCPKGGSKHKSASKSDPKHKFDANKAGICNSCGCTFGGGNHKETKKASEGEDEINGHPIACFAGKDESEWDRYTVVYLDQPEHSGLYACVGLSGHSAAQLGPHLGEEISFAQIPEQLQHIVREDLSEHQYGEGEDPIETTNYAAKHAAFSYALPGIPGQVIEQFYPELQHEIVDYPNYDNAGMEASPEIYGGSLGEGEGFGPGSDGPIPDGNSGYISTSPGQMGVGISVQPEILEGESLRSEGDIRGYGFMDEFYQQQGNAIPGGLFVAALHPKKGSKTAGEDKDHCLQQFDQFLKLVTGEIAATMISAFKVTNRMIMSQVPGVGEIQLAEVERAAIAANAAFNTIDTASRVKYLLDQLNDNEIQEAINGAFAQASVWHDKPEGGYVFEVFVRAEAIDTDTMIMKYKFVTGTKGLD